MRLRTFVFLIATPVLWACNQNEHSNPGCAEDEKLCPPSLMASNAVECECSCQLPHIPLPGARQAKYEGTIGACLPPAINLAIATAAQKQALGVMPQGVFNQQVYKFCSETVADWLSLTIKSQAARFEQLPAGLACQPYRCTCDTSGARFNDSYCESPCTEEACNRETCDPILRQGNILDFSSCACTRTSACGAIAPAEANAGLCRLPGGTLSQRSQRGNSWHPPMLLSALGPRPHVHDVSPIGDLFDADRGRGAWQHVGRVE